MEEVTDEAMELIEGFIVSILDNFLLEELPESFDKAEVWRVGWHKYQSDIECLGVLYDFIVSLVASIIEKDGDVFGFGVGFSYFSEKNLDGFFMAVFFGDKGDDIKINQIEGTEDIESSSSCVRSYLSCSFFSFYLP